MIQNLWDAARHFPKREIYNSLPQETRKISNKQSKLTPKGIQTKHRISIREEIIKIRAEINEMKTKQKKKEK